MPRTGVAKALEGVDMKPHFKYLIRYIRETEEKVSAAAFARHLGMHARSVYRWAGDAKEIIEREDVEKAYNVRELPTPTGETAVKLIVLWQEQKGGDVNLIHAMTAMNLPKESKDELEEKIRNAKKWIKAAVKPKPKAAIKPKPKAVVKPKAAVKPKAKAAKKVQFAKKTATIPYL